MNTIPAPKTPAPANGTAVVSSDAPTAWVLYDADCSICTRFARRFENLLARRRLTILPLQTPWARERFKALSDTDYLAEMRLLYPDGKTFGGADALIEIARHYWWAWPAFILGHVPPFRALMRAGYRWFAGRRHCSTSCSIEKKPRTRHHGPTTFFE
ncbi:MAG TPA: DUF393 domain-containing protein, partial [Verrucomicrobiae bacterium]|nr:DUF393 domain-containing protein [Verrucomicrobiae bacterium]